MYISRTTLGYTLVEMLIIVAIFGALASVVTASLSTAREKAADAVRLTQANQLTKAFELYYLENDEYPHDGRDDSNASTWNDLIGGAALVNTTFADLISEGHISEIASDLVYATDNTGWQYCSSDDDLGHGGSDTYFLFVPLQTLAGEYCYFTAGPVDPDAECTAAVTQGTHIAPVSCSGS
ncbi:MAG: type II secretory pathway pseudopilin PulG [Patiriisocius sp.]|jgi:type II secretory pathway pseudopilin PulG